MNRLFAQLALVMYIFLLVPATVLADFTIVGTVNGGDINTAVSRGAALQIPFSKPVYVQGSIVNNTDKSIHVVKISAKPDIMLFPEIPFAVDSNMGANQLRSTEMTITVEDFLRKYVPSYLVPWLNRTTASIVLKAYQEGSSTPIAQRTVWVHISDEVEAVPQSAIQAITASPVAITGAGLAVVSAAGAIANVARRRKKPGKGKGAVALSAVGAALGTAAVLFAIGAIDFFEFMEVGASGGAVAAGIIVYLAQVLGVKTS